MVGIFEPFNTNHTRQIEFPDFLGLAKCITSSLENQRGSTKLLEIPRARLLGLARRMKWIAKAHQAAHTVSSAIVLAIRRKTTCDRRQVPRRRCRRM